MLAKHLLIDEGGKEKQLLIHKSRQIQRRNGYNWLLNIVECSTETKKRYIKYKLEEKKYQYEYIARGN